MFGWHRLLHNTASFLHAHLVVLHPSFPLALHPHLVNRWPPQTEALLTVLGKDISEVLSTVSLSKYILYESSNWFLVYEPWDYYNVSIIVPDEPNSMPPDAPSF